MWALELQQLPGGFCIVAPKIAAALSSVPATRSLTIISMRAPELPQMPCGFCIAAPKSATALSFVPQGTKEYHCRSAGSEHSALLSNLRRARWCHALQHPCQGATRRPQPVKLTNVRFWRPFLHVSGMRAAVFLVPAAFPSPYPTAPFLDITVISSVLVYCSNTRSMHEYALARDVT